MYLEKDVGCAKRCDDVVYNVSVSALDKLVYFSFVKIG